ncbi:cytokinin dehydrogenase 3-like protein [Tanacetum coccineum]
MGSPTSLMLWWNVDVAKEEGWGGRQPHNSTFSRYWILIDKDVVAVVKEFFVTSMFPQGCNSSFITLITKILDVKVVKDYRPIRLIRSVYKIIAKILASRLSFIIPDLISEVQSTCISKRQILDGPFILNELLSWCKCRKVKAMIFKVDFKKDFDSVKWDYLDDVLKSFGLFKGISINDSLVISHLFYVDDAVFVVFFTLNRALLFKWVWRFIIQESSLWYRFIKAIHGVRGALDISNSSSRRSSWLDIIRELQLCKLKGIDLLALVREKVGNGEDTLFWNDLSLEASGKFSVKSARSLIDDSLLSKEYLPTRWVKCKVVVCGGMERVLSQKGSGVGKGVKEKDHNDVSNKTVKDGAVLSITVAFGSTQEENVGQSSTGPTASESGPDVSFASTGNALVVKEKSLNMSKTNTGFGLSTTFDGTRNKVGPVGDTYNDMEGVTPFMTDMTVEKNKLSSLEDTTVLRSFPSLSTHVTTLAGNALGKSSYANITGKPIGKKVNVRTLFTHGGNGIDVVVSMDSIRAINENLLKEDVSTVPVWVKLHGVPVTAFSKDGLSAIATKLGTPLMLDSYTSDMCMQSWGRSSYARVMIELRADVELKDNIVVAMPKITREGHYTCNVRVEYEWKPPRCSSCKVFGHIYEECPKNTGAGEKKNVKKPSQTSRGVPAGPKMGFKPQKEYRPVSKNPNASSSRNKKKGVEPTIEVSNSNPFDVLNSVDNDVEFGTNGGTTNMVNNRATLSGSYFMNIDNDVEFASNTLIGEKIDKIERQICEGKLRLLDNDGNPLVPTGIVKSDSEVEVIFDETGNLRISTSGKDESDKGYGTNSLLEQCRDSYPDKDDYDPYDDDMYENHDLCEHLQSIYDDLDITVRGRKKK